MNFFQALIQAAVKAVENPVKNELENFLTVAKANEAANVASIVKSLEGIENLTETQIAASVSGFITSEAKKAPGVAAIIALDPSIETQLGAFLSQTLPAQGTLDLTGYVTKVYGEVLAFGEREDGFLT